LTGTWTEEDRNASKLVSNSYKMGRISIIALPRHSQSTKEVSTQTRGCVEIWELRSKR
jgi:hypothetical protein